MFVSASSYSCFQLYLTYPLADHSVQISGAVPYLRAHDVLERSRILGSWPLFIVFALNRPDGHGYDGHLHPHLHVR